MISTPSLAKTVSKLAGNVTPIADEEPHGQDAILDLPTQVTGLLGHPRGGRAYCTWFRWGLLRSVNDLRNGPDRSAATGPRESFWSMHKAESGQYNWLIRWPFGKKVPSQQTPTEPDAQCGYVLDG